VSKLGVEPNKGLDPVSAETAPGGVASPSAPFAPGLTVTRIESLQLPATERAFLLSIAAIWEFEVGDDTPVTTLHVTNVASDPREADGYPHK
jgi:hypothetical protein